jgi:hypothetical protein
MLTAHDDLPCLLTAIDYLRFGWRPVPLCPPDHAGVSSAHATNCRTPGETSVIELGDFMRRPIAIEDLCDFWRKCPNANVGRPRGLHD